MFVELLISEIVGYCLFWFFGLVSNSELSRFQICFCGYVVNGLFMQGDLMYEVFVVVIVCDDIEKFLFVIDCLVVFESFVEIEFDFGGIDLKLQLVVIVLIYYNCGCLVLLENDQEVYRGFCQKFKNLFEILLKFFDLIDIYQIWMFVDYCNFLRFFKEYDKVL